MFTTSLRRFKRWRLLGVAAPLVLLAAPTHARDAQAILSQTCAACHSAEGKNSWSRISHQRKTPEGWLMTIARMQTMHGLKISDEDRRNLVKYLADKQGLAPSETDGARYAMERSLNTVEHIGSQQYNEMCARCHSAARPALQRRPASEWEHLVHFHLGQYPSLEYSNLGRDRDWLPIALKEMVPYLAKQYPLESQAWSDWQKHKPAPKTLLGRWSFSGHLPGKGDVSGVMTVAGGSKDTFKVAVSGRYGDGQPFNGSGAAILYNGYEWRASVKVGGVPMRQVLMAKDGEMQGRMFEEAHDERGLDFHAAKAGSGTILAVQPGYVKAGSEAELTVVGSKLQGKPNFGPGVQVVSVLENTPERLRVKVRAASDAAVGVHGVTLGNLKGGSLAVYREVKEVKVLPDFSVSRIGGNGGSTQKVEGRFDAEAWGQDSAGKPFRIGFVPARWSVEPFDDRAKEDGDVKFSGRMQAESGIFTPGDAGPNPARKMSTNNAGNLKVIATVDDGGRALKGEGHMIVAVQRWNNPPIP